ncbi:MAG TPA: hypothetical protein VGY13_12720 [Solirubrobacteraceae bacterium]|jgi:hypothetical protein|nr:hypothetical protein [Solirubrobacteraceae bacterium]
MLAYLSWHRPAATVEAGAYEQALERFHRSLAHQRPCGFRGSASFRAPLLAWLAAPEGAGGGYEDWYLLEDWAAVGVLEEAAVSRGHHGAHERIAARAGSATSAIYRLVEGGAELGAARVAVWVSRAPGRERPSLETLLADGIEPSTGSLWRRCLGLGPAPEFCLLAAEEPDGAAPARLPHGWSAAVHPRELLWHG